VRVAGSLPCVCVAGCGFVFAGGWQEFETLEFDRPQTLSTTATTVLTFVVAAADDDGGGSDATESTGSSADSEAAAAPPPPSDGQEDGTEPTEPLEFEAELLDFEAEGDDDDDDDDDGSGSRDDGGLPFAGFVCYMDVDLVARGSREIDTLRDRTHWAQQMLLFEATTVYPGELITLEATVDNTRGPFTVYTFEAYVSAAAAATTDDADDIRGSGSGSGRRSLGRVVLDEHF
jgi:hypothetical protein